MASYDAPDVEDARERRRKRNARDLQLRKAKSPLAREREEIASVKQRLEDEAPLSGSNPLHRNRDNDGDGAARMTTALHFRDLPLSSKSQRGLLDGKYRRMTDIQRAALPHALVGRDVLGSAKTGSGKTLAFVLPVIEKLWREQWTTGMDGLGALIVSPTRELALQIFDVFRRVGTRHSLSAGLVIGGKSFEAEQDHISRMSILVGTPGRLQQHIEQTAQLSVDNLQVLVLDEADQLLDMGFAPALNAIVRALPSSRQTLLFSATQTKRVSDLARLSLKDPEYVSVHEQSASSTPLRLQQHFMVIPLQDKLNVLWSFIKSHQRSKTLVFVSACKQVRFLFEAFRKLRPGVPLMHLHGKQKQMKRLAIFTEFCKRKSAVMFATDIAARGLDFPAVDWVLQLDAPESVQQYIHRVGRTARNESNGRGLLVLVPSETAMVTLLKSAKVPLKATRNNPDRTLDVSKNLASLNAEDPELKYLAQKAFVCYLRAVHLQSNKDVFDVHKLPAVEFASSLGLVTAPKIRFSKKQTKKFGPDDAATEHAAVPLAKKLREAKKAKKAAAAAAAAAAATDETNKENSDGVEDDDDGEDQQEREGMDTPGAAKVVALDDDDDDDDDDGSQAAYSDDDSVDAAADDSDDDDDDGDDNDDDDDDGDDDGDGDDDDDMLLSGQSAANGKKKQPRSRMDRLFSRRRARDTAPDNAAARIAANDDSDDDVLRVKRVDHDLAPGILPPRPDRVSKRSMKKLRVNPAARTRVVFAEDGTPVAPFAALATRVEDDVDAAAVQAQRIALKQARDAEDRERQRLRLAEARRKKRDRARDMEASRGSGAGDATAVLASVASDDSFDGDDGGDGDDGDYSDGDELADEHPRKRRRI